MPAIARLQLARLTRTKYDYEFRVLEDAAEAGKFDAWNVSEEDWCFALVFYVLSRSVHSMAGFLTAVKNCYEASSLTLPEGPRVKNFKAGLMRVFGAVDWVRKAHNLSKEEIEKILSPLGSGFEDTVFAVWLLASFYGALRPQDVSRSRLRWADGTWSKQGVEFLIRPKKGSMMHGPTRLAAPFLSPSSVLDLPRRLLHLRSFFPKKWSSQRSILASLNPPHVPIKNSVFVPRLRVLYARTVGVVPGEMGISAYSMRRGMATELHRSGVPEAVISKVLRHKNPDSTRQYIATLESEVRRMHLARQVAKAKS